MTAPHTVLAVADGGQDQATAIPWWKRGPIYHVYPRSFQDSNGDGHGDLRGIIDRLDYINDRTDRSLQASAIWLSPIYLSPGRDVGYDIADHMEVDPSFGTIHDFDELVAKARKRGIRIVLDMVFNHTSDLHRWFLDSRSSTRASRRDWYIWRPPSRGGRAPNNWKSFFGGPAWTFDEATGEYYLHTFLPEQPDLNWHNPEVRAACFEVMRFWLDRGVSGFRLDVFNALFKHPELPNNPRRLARRPWDRQRHIHNKDRPELKEFLLELRQLLDQHPETMAVGETFEGPPELAASYCEHLHMAFNFDVLQQPWRPAAIQRSIQRWDRLLAAEHTWPCYVLSNHDNPRHAWRYSRGDGSLADARAKVAAALLLTLRGTPFIYYGEEIGMLDVTIPHNERWDHDHDNGSRDTARTPMHWDASEHAGFSTHRPWLPVGADYLHRNVAAAERDNRSVLAFYRQLVALRQSSPALLTGGWRALLQQPRDALLYLREHESETALVALNFSSERVRVPLGGELTTRRWTPRLSTRRSDVGWAVNLSDTLVLGALEATVFTTTDLHRSQ